ncbi:MAG: PQQ-binding-like beta-propeller repeat protein [Acidobacteriota bacterium]|nr:PQQ-binding-like beta-propeller repeat protein [Acidobacteriota bacterium]
MSFSQLGSAARQIARGLVAVMLLAIAARADDSESWPQWGGPQGNFRVEGAELADSWPAEGPPRLWARELGDGHSAIVVAGARLYTQYRPRRDVAEGEFADREAVIALDAETGARLWEAHYPSEPMDFTYGAGPHSTPLVADDRVFAVSTRKRLSAFEATSGQPAWSRDLVAELGAPPTLIRPVVKAGYGPSPVAWEDLVIVTVGGKGQAVVAFRQDTGEIAWRSGDFLISPSTPLLIELDGDEQLVIFASDTVHGLDPSSGEVLWSHPHLTEADMNISTPVWGADGILFLSSAFDGGSQALRLRQIDGATRVEKLWYTTEFRIMFGSAVRVGDLVYGSSGDLGPSFVGAVNVRTGKVAFRQRGFARANFLYADSKLVALDEDGVLSLSAPGPAGIETLSRIELLDTVSWTVPTLAGTVLYVRDRSRIMALDLGR